MSRRLAVASGLIGAAMVGSVVTVALVGGPSVAAAPGTLPTATATVVRTNLADTQLTEGTLGYAATDPVLNRVSGTYTALPDPGATVPIGGVLYRVDDQPVVLMAGTTPAWRPLVAGMSDGPDVTELQQNLVSLGFARGLLSTPTGHFDTATMDAVERWQTAVGVSATGQVGLGQIVFLAAAVRVGALNVSPGQPASPGDAPFQVTTTTRVVSVPLDPNLPTVQVGEAVSIVLPDNSTTPGSITAIGPPPPAGNSASNQSDSGGGGSGQSQVTAVAVVMPSQPAATGSASDVAVQVSLTVQSVAHVLAVPIPALLALAGGGYGLEVVGPTGVHHLLGVTTGVFTGTQVEVSGAGLASGMKVVVAQ